MPTSFIGVAELGLIAGAGMLIAFACTMTFLPAAITLCRPPGEGRLVGFAWAAPLDPLVAHRRRPILVVAAVLAVLAAAVSPRLQFDSDPLDTQNPHTEPMETLRDLLNNPVTNPYSIDVLAPNVADGGGAGGKDQAAADGVAGDRHRQLRAGRPAAEARHHR